MTIKRTLRASILALLLAPFVLVLLATGTVFLWENLWLLKWLWIPIPFCWLMGFLLIRIVKKRYGSVWQLNLDILPHWTDQDREAWQLVSAFADRQLPAADNRFLQADLYLETTQQLAVELARHYHANAKSAIENLTIPEILTAAELAVSDIRRFVERNIPGSHLMTIRWLRRAPQVTGFWNKVRPLYYAASLIWHPWTILSRAATNETVMNPVMEELKQEGLASLYRAFVLQLGKYLIELNSHRLKVGPERWRQLMQEATPPQPAKTLRRESATQQSPAPLQIALVGQVKAGKSSLVNALIGQQQAAVDILPLTDTVEQYTIHTSADTQLTLLDTVGYAHEGLKPDRVDVTMQTVCRSSMTILVMNVCDPAREPDCDLLRKMEAWFRQRPQLRRPPILVVLTHIDQLSPSLEWEPPYDGWLRPRSHRPKERSIHEAVLAVRELLGTRVNGVVPACTDVDHARVYGIDESVVPAILILLPQAKAKQLLDVLYNERDQGRTTRMLSQLWNAASTLAKYHFCGIDALLPEPKGDERKDVEVNE